MVKVNNLLLQYKKKVYRTIKDLFKKHLLVGFQLFFIFQKIFRMDTAKVGIFQESVK